MTPEQATKGSPLALAAVSCRSRNISLLRRLPASPPAAAVASLNKEGYWLAPLGYTSHPYKGDGPKTVAPGNYRTTHVGDDSDTSPYPDSVAERDLDRCIHPQYERV